MIGRILTFIGLGLLCVCFFVPMEGTGNVLAEVFLLSLNPLSWPDLMALVPLLSAPVLLIAGAFHWRAGTRFKGFWGWVVCLVGIGGAGLTGRLFSASALESLGGTVGLDDVVMLIAGCLLFVGVLLALFSLVIVPGVLRVPIGMTVFGMACSAEFIYIQLFQVRGALCRPRLDALWLSTLASVLVLGGAAAGLVAQVRAWRRQVREGPHEPPVEGEA